MGYLSGLQQIEDIVNEFEIIDSGTIDITTNQYPSTANVLRPDKVYRNYILFIENKSGVTLNGGTVNSVIDGMPNRIGESFISLGSMPISTTVPNNGRGSFFISHNSPNPFVGTACYFMMTLATAPTLGTINWLLIGY